MVVKVRGEIDATRTTTFEPENGGTKYITSVEYTVPIPLFGELAEPFFNRQNEHEDDTFIANLNARMEM